MAGVERFELPNDGVRVRSLTAWRYPNKYNILFPTGTAGKEFFMKKQNAFALAPHKYILYYNVSVICKCFEAISSKFSNFFIPSRKQR